MNQMCEKCVKSFSSTAVGNHFKSLQRAFLLCFYLYGCIRRGRTITGLSLTAFPWYLSFHSRLSFSLGAPVPPSSPVLLGPSFGASCDGCCDRRRERETEPQIDQSRGPQGSDSPTSARTRLSFRLCPGPKEVSGEPLGN